MIYPGDTFHQSVSKAPPKTTPRMTQTEGKKGTKSIKNISLISMNLGRNLTRLW